MSNIEKSEGQKEYPFDPIKELERISTDEYLVEMNAKADVVEQYLNTHDVNRHQLTKLTDDLDKSWIHMNQKVAVWGAVYTSRNIIAPNVVNYETENAKGITLTSTGFIPLPLTVVLDNEAVIYTKIAYSFRDKNVHVSMLREGFVGEFPDSGPAMAVRRFEYHYPGEAALIQQLAENVEDGPSVTPILNYVNYEVVTDPRTAEGKAYINDIQTYLYEAMNFDTRLPYVIKCELDESDDDHDSSIVQIVASPVRIRLISPNEDYISGSHRHIPCVDLIVYDADRNKPDMKLLVPIRSLIRFDSIRRTDDNFTA